VNKEPARNYTPIPDVKHTYGMCNTRLCYAIGDLGDGICVNCWDRKRDKPTTVIKEKNSAKQ
jgi:hypothetical protein